MRRELRCGLGLRGLRALRAGRVQAAVGHQHPGMRDQPGGLVDVRQDRRAEAPGLQQVHCEDRLLLDLPVELPRAARRQHGQGGRRRLARLQLLLQARPLEVHEAGVARRHEAEDHQPLLQPRALRQGRQELGGWRRRGHPAREGHGGRLLDLGPPGEGQLQDREPVLEPGALCQDRRQLGVRMGGGLAPQRRDPRRPLVLRAGRDRRRPHRQRRIRARALREGRRRRGDELERRRGRRLPGRQGPQGRRVEAGVREVRPPAPASRPAREETDSPRRTPRLASETL
mmetsp:Transcript_74945/g.231760  ORF Transcript_74945/g.231760 Transcript_74945/m.231760 type:complete len:286 (+) Transcript_74945:724-1581(+)